jgi:dodecin
MRTTIGKRIFTKPFLNGLLSIAARRRDRQRRQGHADRDRPSARWQLYLRNVSIGDTMTDPVSIRARFGCIEWEETMTDSLYKVIEIIGTSPQSWDLAAKNAVERAAKTLRELRVAEVVEQDIEIRNGKLEQYRVKLKVSFKYEDDDKP